MNPAVHSGRMAFVEHQIMSEEKKTVGIQSVIRPDQVTGVVLAGGKSTRYGRNKALVEMKGIRLIDRVIGVIGSVFQHLLLVTNTPHEYAYLGLPMVEDLIKGLGPIGGIYTGLKTISDPAGFFVACDMPFVNPHLIHWMIEISEGYDVVVPRLDWKIEPLHALYKTTCLPFVEEAIRAEKYQIFHFYDKLRVRYLSEEEIRPFDVELKIFVNVNKPDELIKASLLEP